MNSPDLELLPLWRRCVEHALVNYGDTMPAELRLWFAEQLMHDGLPIVNAANHASLLCRLSWGTPLYCLTPAYGARFWEKGTIDYARDYNIT